MCKLHFILSPMDSDYMIQSGIHLLKRSRIENLEVKVWDTFFLDTNPEAWEHFMQDLGEATMVFILLHGGLCHFKKAEAILATMKGRTKFFIRSGIDDENLLFLSSSGLTLHQYDQLLRYILNGNAENYYHLFLYTASTYGNLSVEFEKPKNLLWQGIYENKQVVKEETSFLEAVKSQDKLVIGVIFYAKYFHEGNLEHIDALAKAIKDRGGTPLCVFTASAPNEQTGAKGVEWILDHYFSDEGKPIVHAIVNTMGYSQSVLSSPGDGTIRVQSSIFEKRSVPVIQAMTTYQSYDTWKENLRGIDAMSFVGSVYYPEFDGQIISTTFAYADWMEDELGRRILHRPIEERTDHISALALNWAALQRKSNAQKKIAILFHNMPPRNDMIGCAFGLDTPKAVYDIVEALKKAGIKTSYDFKDGDDIIKRIIEAVSNDQRWLSPRQVLERACAVIPEETYQNWTQEMSPKMLGELERDWGVAPGECMVHEGKMPVPGILNGNIFIGLQPSRGYEEKAEEVYHSTDIVPPHQYLAYYDWIEKEFKADIIAHMGTHGTLEWLPGKEVALSRDCYPDANIAKMPHIYPYCITVLGEGVQVKRRSNGVILDHLIPALILSDTYEATEKIEDLLTQYHQAQVADPGKRSYLEGEIADLSIQSNLHKDLGIAEEEFRSNVAKYISQLHLWIDEIKNTLIKDGLHYYGCSPREERYENLVAALLRLDNGEIPSLPRAWADAQGLDVDALRDHPMDIDWQGKTNLQKLNEIETQSREMIREFIQEKMTIASAEKLAKGNASLRTLLNFTSETVAPKLEQTTEELDHFVAGVLGKFVPPGQGGAPTRGNVHILPTGRNFFAIDPQSVPNRGAWKVGKQLALQALQRFKEEEGKDLETIAIVVYAGETMKTSGDDIAQILYLMGVQPKWLEGRDKVMGIEPISLQELGRPRVDVTLRISGLFRDTFPNLIELVEEAVQMIIHLEEPEEMNYLKRNYNREIQKLLEEGYRFETAQEEAGLRIFSDPPGTYGAGVSQLIESKNWKEVGDLGKIYTFWGGHGYGKHIHGKRVTHVFERRLSHVQMTIKNESSMEIDMLESDDFYNYHGGLIAAVREASGTKPRSYCGDTSDPSRVKTKDVREQGAKIMRARILNPKWFEGLKEHGYKGAQEVSGMMDYVFGWDATADIIENWMYDKICDHFLLDEERRNWMEEVNPWAVANIGERLLEAHQRGLWETSGERLEALKKLYLSVEGNIERGIHE